MHAQFGIPQGPLRPHGEYDFIRSVALETRHQAEVLTGLLPKCVAHGFLRHVLRIPWYCLKARWPQCGQDCSLGTATWGGCCICLQVIQSCHLTTHRRDHSSLLHSEFWTNMFSRPAGGSWENPISRSSSQGMFWSLQFAQEAIQIIVHPASVLSPLRQIVWQSYFKTSDSLEVWVSLLIWHLN